jgi:uracil-DNA glycosylase
MATPVLIVGEAPGREFGGEPLAGYASRLPGIESHDRENLLAEWPGKDGKGDAFPWLEAKDAAEILLHFVPPDVRIVLMGTRVARAFGFERHEYVWLTWFGARGRTFAVCPHPSGIVRWWNDPANVRRARGFFEELDAPPNGD